MGRAHGGPLTLTTDFPAEFYCKRNIQTLSEVIHGKSSPRLRFGIATGTQSGVVQLIDRS